MGIFDFLKGNKSSSKARKEALKHVLFGCTLANSNQFDDAIPLFQKAIKIDDNCAKAYYALGLMYSKKGMNEEAKTAYNKAIQINPDYKTELKNFGLTGPDEESFNIIKEIEKTKKEREKSE